MKDTLEDRQSFNDCITTLFKSLGGEITDDIRYGYWIALEDIPLQQVQQACYLAIRNAKFVPRPVELRELIFGRAEDKAESAWQDVCKAIPLGSYRHINFTDRFINATIRSLGGWPSFISRLTDSENEKWARKEFLQCYASLASRGVDGDACRSLPGLSDVQMDGGKIVKPKPINIGKKTTQLRLNNGEES